MNATHAAVSMNIKTGAYGNSIKINTGHLKLINFICPPARKLVLIPINSSIIVKSTEQTNTGIIVTMSGLLHLNMIIWIVMRTQKIMITGIVVVVMGKSSMLRRKNSNRLSTKKKLGIRNCSSKIERIGLIINMMMIT